MGKAAAVLTAASLARYLGQMSVLLIVSLAGSPESVGVLTLSLAITGPGFVLLGLGIRTLILTHVGEHSLLSYMWLRAVSGAAAVIINAGLVCLLLPATAWPVGFGVIAMKLADYGLDLATAWYQPAHRWRGILTISLGAALATAGGGIAGALLGSATAAAALAGSAALAVTLIFAVAPLVRECRQDPPTSISNVLGLARAGLPLGVSYGVVSLLVAVPQYVLAGTLGVTSAGRFGVMFYLVTAAELITNPFSQAWVQRARASQQGAPIGRAFVLREVAKYTIGFLPVFIAGCAAGYLLLPVIFGSYYLPAFDELAAVLACMSLIPAVYLGAGALAIANRYRTALLIVLPALIAVVAVSFVTVPALGVAGAFLALLAGLVLRASMPPLLLSGRGTPT